MYLVLLLLINTVFAADTGLSKEADHKIFFEFADNIPESIQHNSSINLKNYLDRHPSPLSDQDKNELLQLTPEIVAKSSQPYGYFHAECFAKNKPHPESHIISIHCDLGPPIITEKIEINVTGPGKNLIETSIVQHQLPSQEGKQFKAKDYEDSKQLLLQIAYENGYINADTSSSKLTIDTDHNKASLVLHIESNQAYEFGEINIPQSIYNKDFLKGMANFSTGERYQSKLLNDYQNNLQLSGLFNIVSIKPSLKDKRNNPRIPILVQYEPIDKTQYRIGFGYNTDTQFNGSIGYTQNRLGERGEKINTEIHLSEKKVDLQANIFIPKSHPKFDFYTIETQYLDETIITENRDKNIYLTFNHTWIENYSQTHFFDRKMSVIYTIDWSKAENEPTIKRQLIYPKLVYQYIFKSPERTIIASLGAEIEGNTEFLLSKLSFYKVLLHSNIRTSEFYNLRLLIKNRFGILDSSNTLPLSWYFRTGGTYSVRGFDYESIGEEELSQNKMMFTHTTEIQRKLYESIYASLFYDAGNASEDIFSSKASQSLGTGLVWESPFGDIELSLAWPIQNYSIDQDHYKFHIALKKGFY